MSGSVALVLDYIERKDDLQIKAYSWPSKNKTVKT